MMCTRFETYERGVIESREDLENFFHHASTCPDCRKKLGELIDKAAGKAPWEEWMPSNTQGHIRNELLTTLEELQATRAIDTVSDIFEQLLPEIPHLRAQRNASRLLYTCAKWLDSGHSHPGVEVDITLSNLGVAKNKLSELAIARLDPEDRCYQTLAEAIIALMEDRPHSAARKIRAVLEMPASGSTPALERDARALLARYFCRKHQYAKALNSIRKGRFLAQQEGLQEEDAHFALTEAWALFMTGQWREPRRILCSAAQTLADSGDLFSVGNAYSALGRIERRFGVTHYWSAIEYFHRAIEQYELSHTRHANLGRAHLHLGFTKALLATEVEKAVCHRKNVIEELGEVGEERFGHQIRSCADEVGLLRKQAKEEFQVAGRIYGTMRQHRGMGMVLIYHAHLLLDEGDLDEAARLCERAFALGKENSDAALMARASIVQCMLENARLELLAGGSSVRSGSDSQSAWSALKFAQRAVHFAKQHTEDSRRLMARAWTWLGLTYTNSYFANVERGIWCCEKASPLMDSWANDYAVIHLHNLKQRVYKCTPKRISRPLRSVVEEHIYQTWDSEQRSVTQTAKVLHKSSGYIKKVLDRIGATICWHEVEQLTTPVSRSHINRKENWED